MARSIFVHGAAGIVTRSLGSVTAVPWQLAVLSAGRAGMARSIFVHGAAVIVQRSLGSTPR